MTASRSVSPRVRSSMVALVVAAPACVQTAWGQSRASGDAGARDADTARDAGRPATPQGLGFGEVIGENFGYGGLGLRGTPRPTHDASAIGLGGLGTLGHGAGTGSRAGLGSGMGGMRRPAVVAVQVSVGDTSSRVEGLPALVVRRVVSRHRAALAYCFARSPGPADAGVPSATVRFTVRPDGTVTPVDLAVSAAAAGPDVPACLRARVLAMVFPPTRDGEPVTVAQALAATAPAAP